MTKRQYGTKRTCREPFWLVDVDKRTEKHQSKKLVGFCACSHWGGPGEPKRYDHWKARHHCPTRPPQRKNWDDENTCDWVNGVGFVR